MIQFKATADRLGVAVDDVDEFLRGRATARVAARLGLTLGDIDSFVSGGYVGADVATMLKLDPPAAVDELAKTLGREGRIGLLIGLMFNS
jgi:hypothetical protein